MRLQEFFAHQALAVFGPEERAGLSAAFRGSHSYQRGETIVLAGERPPTLQLVVDGWAVRFHMLEEGLRQTTDFILPGEFCDLAGLGERRMDHVSALTSLTVATLDGSLLSPGHPGLARAFLRLALREQAILRAWLVCFGLREKREHLAHLICELHHRLHQAGLVGDHEFDLPLTQAELAEVLGATAVHTNRVLQGLRKDGLIELRDQRLRILRLPELQELAEFDSGYLEV